MPAPESPLPAFGTRGSALVLVADHRAALATVLVLQEMGLSVDIAGDADAALAWVRMANYNVVVFGGDEVAGPRTAEAQGGPKTWVDVARRMRAAAPHAQIMMLSDRPSPDVAALGIEVLSPPINVNHLGDRLAAA